MELTGIGPIIICATLAGALFGMLVLGRPNWGGRGVRAATRGVQAVLLNLVVVALAFAVLNDQYVFYSSWGDLLGGRSGQVLEHHGSTSAQVQDAKVNGPGLSGLSGLSGPRDFSLPQPSSRLQTYSVRDQLSGLSTTVLVYLPLGYDPASARDYPVILGLHGFPGSPQSLAKLNYLSTADQLTTEHQLAPSIFVIPTVDVPSSVDTECINGPPGEPQTETWLTRELPAWVVQHLHVRTDRAAWVTMGYSYGAWCAAMLTMRHPDLFAGAIVFQGYFRPDFGVDYDPFSPGDLGRYDLIHLAQTAPPPVALWVLASRQDALSYPTTARFLSVAKAPLDVTSVVLPAGGHRFSVFEPFSPTALTWLANTLKPFRASTSQTSAASRTVTSAPSTRSAPNRSAPLRIVGLGDSVPANSGCPCSGYIADVGTALQARTHRPTQVRNDAVGGWTTADVLADLDSTDTKADLAGATLVIVQVGANDFDPASMNDPSCLPAATSPCWSASLARLHRDLTAITRRIRQIDPSPALRIALLGYWNVSVDGMAGAALGHQHVAGSEALTTAVNDTIKAVATESSESSESSVATEASGGQALYVDAYTGFKDVDGNKDPTGLLLDDGDHPNAAGNTLLFDAVEDALVRSGAMAAWTAP